jgi:DNA-binding transcriptional LysR family regulator
MRRTDLPALAIFDAVASERSFRGAARRLGLSVSAISHAINGLEQRMGVRLLARTTRSVAPTEAGERLLRELRPALASIAGAVELASASQDHVSGTIRISVPRSAAELLLVPLSARFVRAYPQVAVEVVVEDGFVDPVAAGFDAGVRLGESLQQDMIAVPVGLLQRAAIVGAPSYFQDRAIPLSPKDLRHHVCIQRRFAGGGLYRWEFQRGREVVEVTVEGSLIFNDDRLAVQAALEGAGLAFAFEGQVMEEIRARRLVRVLQDWCESFPGFFLYYPSRRFLRPALRAFVDFIHQDNARSEGRARPRSTAPMSRPGNRRAPHRKH